MGKYRKILVAYDGSPSSQNALAVSMGIAQKEKSWIKVLAVVPAYDGDLELIGVSNIKETIEGPGQELLKEAKALAEDQDVHISFDLEQGEPFERIVHVAEEENCDLIVMGRSGLSHLERELMGGVTARVIGHTDSDVLVVSEDASVDWSRILVATDGSENSETAIRHGLVLAKKNGARFNAITVVERNEELLALAPEHLRSKVEEAQHFMEDVEKKCSDEGVVLNTFIREGEPHTQITQLADELDASIIVMGTHGRKGLSRLLMGSVTERTIGYARPPVMIVH